MHASVGCGSHTHGGCGPDPHVGPVGTTQRPPACCVSGRDGIGSEKQVFPAKGEPCPSRPTPSASTSAGGGSRGLPWARGRGASPPTGGGGGPPPRPPPQRVAGGGRK